MSNQNSKLLKEKFLKFFVQRGYQQSPPASLIPDESDPSVLFTSAGMQQFKRFYLDPERAPAPQLVTCQPCLRTSDIDVVGDENHLTFFEMLGNFSFGEKDSYEMKKRAIEEAWEFVTKELNIAPKRITASIFGGDKEIKEDKESLAIWQKVASGLEIKKQGREDNFWGLGRPNTPCGRTSEIYVDGLEIWNLVFNEFLDQGEGKITPLKYFGVDTGMGLERLIAVLNNQKDVFRTDIYQSLIQRIEKITSAKYPNCSRSFRIISDHWRASVALAETGLEPHNKDRGYILRRLIRRAIVYLYQLQPDARLTDIVTKKSPVAIIAEETKFRQTLQRGLREFQKITERQQNISGQVAFDLFQTYGLPLEITKDLVQQLGLEIDENGFWQAINDHRRLSRASTVSKFASGLADHQSRTIVHHTACHLLLAGLRRVLGDHVHQRGSNITAERLRLDFSHPEKLTSEQIKDIEDWVNDKIKRDLLVTMEEMTVAEAKESGAVGVFDERYGDWVKVYTIVVPATGEVISKEICAGPHIKSTGELGKFVIIKEEAVGSGVRRIKAKLCN